VQEFACHLEQKFSRGRLMRRERTRNTTHSSS
jgi:hypothetical protein